jgi:maltose/moltooligosaccharide transporter
MLVFFGIQYSFGLQSAKSIYDFCMQALNPILNLAGPLTGLLIQPIIGAMSDKTWHPRWGQKTLLFLLQ